jgi:acetyl-CoA carboxylase biotin carboxyl carrier protein
LQAQELRDLIELISKSNFVTFELEREGFKLKLAKGATLPAGSPPPSAAGAPVQASPASLPLAYPVAAAAIQEIVPPPLAAPAPQVDIAPSGLIDMTSPIVGTFYRQPSQAAPPFVEPGSRVKKGQVLCIIEAMKLMNEIEAEIDAEVVEILVANGQPVEFGEILFRLRPMAS